VGVCVWVESPAKMFTSYHQFLYKILLSSIKIWHTFGVPSKKKGDERGRRLCGGASREKLTRFSALVISDGIAIGSCPSRLFGMDGAHLDP
jgi:hypothetical protein